MGKRRFGLLGLIVGACCFGNAWSVGLVSAVARESSLTLTMEQQNQSIELMPGEYGESNNTTINASTDNYTGYSLYIASQSTIGMTNGSGDAIESISSAISGSAFLAGDAYFNKWGFKPSQYISVDNNTSTTVMNSDYLPAPTTSGLLIDSTAAANSTANQYTMSFAAKVGNELPAGTYTHVNVITLAANDIVYNITYDKNTTDEVTNMPSPNPQSTTIDGGTATEDSYATISENKPVQNEKKFAGWCDVTTGTN